ncbi:MAG: ATP-binding protein [Acidimicrobiales bacterium]
MSDSGLASAGDPSVHYLWERLDLVTDRLLAAADPGSDEIEGDPTSWEERLASLETEAAELEEDGVDLTLRRIARSFGLDRYSVDVMLLALAAELSPRVREMARREHRGADLARPSLGLVLRAVGLPDDHRGVAAVLGDGSPLARFHLVELESTERPLLTRPVAIPDRVARGILGVPGVDVALRELQAPLVGVDLPEASRVARAVEAGIRTVYVREHPGRSGTAFAAAVLDELGISGVAFDLRRAGADQTPYGLTASIVREGGLLDSAVVLGPIDPLVDRDLTCLAPLQSTAWPVFVVGSRAWEPSWTRSVPLLVDAPRPHPDAVRRVWTDHFAATDTEVAGDVDALTAVLRMPPEQTLRAAIGARLEAAADGSSVTAAHVRSGARGQSAGRLEQMAERVEPRTRLDDLVLPSLLLAQVRQVVERGRHRDRVLDEWNMGGLGSRGRGITALFAGDSGTGKTLSAEAIAGELGVDLYVIDLSTVVDKYVGETEKNLGRVFDEAEGVNGVLFFDEADALFGKRTDTSDAKDRYANVEVAYLLQRMERFDGVAVLATNLRSNIDEAFTRRLDVIVHFTIPDPDHRRLLWERHLPATLPQEPDLDLDFLARRFELSGGVIRNVTLTAAYQAAERDGRVSMGDLVRALSVEYTKMGRLFDTSGLDPWDGELGR